MNFTLTGVDGAMRSGTLDDIGDLLDSLREADAEHPDVAIQTDTGISLSAFADGLVFIEDVEAGELEPHWAMIPEREDLIDLVAALGRDGPAHVMSLVSWQPGYGPQR